MNTSPPSVHGFDHPSGALNNDTAILTCKNCDNDIRWKVGDRLERLFEQRCDRFVARGQEDHRAVVTDDVVLSYLHLDNRANQLAHYLHHKGVQSGDHIGLLFDKTLHTYIALLAVLKLNAAYVPPGRWLSQG